VLLSSLYIFTVVFLAYSLTIYAEGQLAQLMGTNIPSNVGSTCHHSDDPMVFTILEANEVKPECKYFCPL